VLAKHLHYLLASNVFTIESLSKCGVAEHNHASPNRDEPSYSEKNLNKSHRVVWSESRGAFIVAHEYAATSGKRSSTKSVIAQSLAVAALIATALPAAAQTYVFTTPGQNLSNPAGSTIQGTSGGAGAQAIGVAAGAVTNSGTIASGTAPGDGGTNNPYGIWVGGAGALTGGITNTGTLSLITGTGIGINVTTGSSVANVVNSGSVIGTSVSGVTIGASSIGNISNVGTASLIQGGTVGVAIISGGSSAGVVNAGTIMGGQDGVYVKGTGSTLGAINNAGLATISGTVFGVSVEGGAVGPISNQGTITGGQAGIFVTTVGSITSIANMGSASVISGSTAVGIEVTGTGTIGSVTNQGTIAGATNGIFLKNAGASIGSLTNSGLIKGSNNAIVLQTGAHLGPVTNSNSGTMSGGNTGLAIYNSASVSSISNTGTIVGTNQAALTLSSAASAGTLNNSGVMNGGRSGIRLGGNSSIGSVQNTGTILGINSNGIQLYGGSSITGGITNSGGLIQGQSRGIVAFTGSTYAGGITNSGTIASSATNYGKGIWISDSVLSGGVSNLSTGVISGASQGIYVGTTSTLSGGISNAGTITGGVGFYYSSGILVQSNSTLTGGIVNRSGGVISGASGIGLHNSTLDSISNLSGGTISGLYGGVVLETGHVTAGISNAGIIKGGSDGIALYSGSTLSGGVTNSGTIMGTNTQYSSGISLYSSSTLSGGIHNLSGGVISGASNGILVADSRIDSITNAAGGTISNTGTSNNLNSGGAALSIYQATVTGSIVNAGIISGSYRGIFITSGNVFGSNTGNGSLSSLVGGVTNSGLITAPSIGVLVAGSTISGAIANSGEINGGVVGVALIGSSVSGGISNIGSSASMTGSLAGLYLADSAVTGGVTNSGLIGGTGGYGIFMQQASVSGGINNLSGGTIAGNDGLFAVNSVIDSISNASGATISGNLGTAGIGVLLGSATLTGQLANSGVIAGSAAGVAVENSTVSGGISNAGTITAVGAGVALSSGAQVSGGLQNSGNIIGGATAVAVTSSATLSGGIVNSGAIAGGKTAIAVLGAGSSLAGGISNSGTITGGTNGIAVKTSSVVTGGIVNSGVIAGGVVGISLGNTGSVAGGLYDTGTISGGLYSVYVDAGSSLGAITIAGKTAQFAGDVYSPNSAVTVASGATFTGTNAFNVQSFDVAAGALFNMGTMASTAGEASGITVANGVTNEGVLSVGRNLTNITGSYTQAASGKFGLAATSDTNYGRLFVSGAANLSPNANIVVNVAANNTLTNKETLVGVITSTDLSATTFNVTDNSDIISFKGIIDGNNVDLVTSYNALVLPDVLANHNSNAIGAATVLDQIILMSGGSGSSPFSGVIQDIAKLHTSAQVSNAASQTLPLLSGDANVATYAALSQMNQVVQSRQAGNYGMSAGSPYVLDQNAWIRPFGSWANLGNSSNAPGFTSGVSGVALGGDAAISNAARVGLAFAYANADVSGNSHDAPNNDRINLYQLMGYGSYALDPRTEINAQIDGGVNSNSGNRQIDFARTTATSSFNSSDAHVGIGIAREVPLSDATTFTPQVRVDYTWINSDGYSEGGAGPLDLHVQSTSFESLLTQFNGKLTQRVSDYLTVFGNLGIGYDSMARDNSAVVAAFAGAPGLSFTTTGVGLKPRVLLGGLGVVSTQHGNMPEVSLRYDLQQREGFADQSISFKARWAF
jgi:hypothetical protein